MGAKNGVWACELVPPNTPHHPTHPGDSTVEEACNETAFPYCFTHWQLLNGRKVNPISLTYEIFGAPVGFDTSHLCKKCHQRLPHHDPWCPRARSEAKVAVQKRKRDFAEAKEKREAIIAAAAAKPEKEIKVCEKFLLGLCFDQLVCVEVHPSQSPESYREIRCALDEPSLR